MGFLSGVLYYLSAFALGAAFEHPGLLHTEADFARIKRLVEAESDPWLTGWEKLANHANPEYTASPQEVLCRGTGWDVDCTENYAALFRDVSSAYANAIYWKVTGDETYADAAAGTLDSWASTLTSISGSSDKFLAAGLYGYQLANVGEILRTYESWTGLSDLAEMLTSVFYPMNHRFLDEHNGAEIDHYWANWDLCNLCSMHAIGVLADNQSMVDEAIDYFYNGAGNGAVTNTIWFLHEEEGGKRLGQGQEAGRDQGHATLDFALLGVLAQQSYNQGEDLFAASDNLILAGSEYMSKYSAGHDVPFASYDNSDGVNQTAISDTGRGLIRPIGELLYAHYGVIKGLNASWTAAYRDVVVEDGNGAEGGGSDYGSTSGAYDQFGFGTLLYRLE
ncbi:hypothetical protein DL764_001272 [Monosporascus ibericus]|uniref:Alginate lyase domain-containing protein n=1 Tax=Monosporascus ibericus TaxID=155417 RepID=A0A4Q4TVB6_9PEZI|nr:hypothetical protein DL764_001272 [Monosporascus ibericus]